MSKELLTKHPDITKYTTIPTYTVEYKMSFLWVALFNVLTATIILNNRKWIKPIKEVRLAYGQN